MSKLHELLAVESALEKAANKLMKESLHTLDKENLFNGQIRRLEMFRAEDKNSETTEYQELTTTVDENIDYLVGPLSNWLDAVLQKEKTNQTAIADLILQDGTTIAQNVPATFLLGLEKKLTHIRSIYEKIPTLIPGIKWEKDEQERVGIYRAANDLVQMKTRKDPEFRVAYEATEHHPAQIVQVDRVMDVGKYITTSYSGRMAPVEKAERLKRIDELLRATKKARMRANSVEVQKGKIGQAMFNYING